MVVGHIYLTRWNPRTAGYLQLRSILFKNGRKNISKIVHWKDILKISEVNYKTYKAEMRELLGKSWWWVIFTWIWLLDLTSQTNLVSLPLSLSAVALSKSFHSFFICYIHLYSFSNIAVVIILYLWLCCQTKAEHWLWKSLVPWHPRLWNCYLIPLGAPLLVYSTTAEMFRSSKLT